MLGYQATQQTDPISLRELPEGLDVNRVDRVRHTMEIPQNYRLDRHIFIYELARNRLATRRGDLLGRSLTEIAWFNLNSFSVQGIDMTQFVDCRGPQAHHIERGR